MTRVATREENFSDLIEAAHAGAASLLDHLGLPFAPNGHREVDALALESWQMVQVAIVECQNRPNTEKVTEDGELPALTSLLSAERGLSRAYRAALAGTLPDKAVGDAMAAYGQLTAAHRVLTGHNI